jgi:hypothetical protein
VQDRLRRAGRPRRPQHERHAVVVRARIDERGDAIGGDQRGRLRHRDDPVDLGTGKARVHGDEHRAGQPHADERRDRARAVGELDGDGLARPDTGVAERVGALVRRPS